MRPLTHSSYVSWLQPSTSRTLNRTVFTSQLIVRQGIAYRRSRHQDSPPSCAVALQNQAAGHRYLCHTLLCAGQRPCFDLLTSSTAGKKARSDRSAALREVAPVQRLAALPERQAAIAAQARAAKPEGRQRCYCLHADSLVPF